MNYIDTHAHLYLKPFAHDSNEVVKRSLDNGISHILLPNIDSSTIEDMISLSKKHPSHCHPMIGLHPTSVADNYREELAKVLSWLDKIHFCGIGEIGIDLYHDTTYLKAQQEVLDIQLAHAVKHNLPVSLHMRSSYEALTEVVFPYAKKGLKGVFHCFQGSLSQAQEVIDHGFMLGVGGVITFKNNNFKEIIQHIDVSHLLLETDAPYLAPQPFRGKRNEPSFIPYVARKIADVKHTDITEIAKKTTNNALHLFRIEKKEPFRGGC